VGTRLILSADKQIVPKLAALPSVKVINPYSEPSLDNNVASGIINATFLNNDHHLDGSGQIIGIADSALDKGRNDGTILADFRGRIIRIHPRGNPNDPRDFNGHGTHVAGSVLGNGANSNGKIKGMAPGAKLVFQSVMDPEGGLGGIGDDLYSFFQESYDDGAVLEKVMATIILYRLMQMSLLLTIEIS
jgi:subtilisin family serine protease